MSQGSGVDQRSLEEIDREIDALIGSGQWSLESYRVLRARALAALSSDDHLLKLGALAFIDDAAESVWREATSKRARLSHLPRAVRQLVQTVRAGWVPFARLPRGHSLKWNAREIGARSIAVNVSADDSTSVIVEVDPQDVSFDGHAPNGIVRDRLQAILGHGWVFESTNAILVQQELFGTGNGRLTFRAHGGRASLENERPGVFVLPLEIAHSLPIGNLHSDRPWLVGGRLVATSSGRIGLCLRGAYGYVLVESKVTGTDDKDERSTYSLVVESPGGIDRTAFWGDFLSLQFVLGQRIEPGLLFGLSGTNVVSIDVPPARGGRESRNAYEVTGDWHFAGARVVELFARLSRAVRAETHGSLSWALDLFLKSLDDSLDLALQDLLLAVAALTASTGELSSLSHGTRVREFMSRQSVTVPHDLADRIDALSRALSSNGSVTPRGASDAELERLFDLERDLRIIVVALVALEVGYRGGIGGQPNRGPPTWWPFSEPDSIETYSASCPPEDLTRGVRDEQLLVLVACPDQQNVLEWLLATLGQNRNRVVVGAAASRQELGKQVKHLKSLGARLVLVVDSPFQHVPTAVAAIRKELQVPEDLIEIAPAIPCVEAWMFADDEFASSQPGLSGRASDLLPEHMPDARALAHQVFGPPDAWGRLPQIDIFRAAGRSPSLRHLFGLLTRKLDMFADLPERSVSRGLSRDAIAGLIRSLLVDDAVAWRTSGGETYTAAELAREVEQGTEAGRQYAVDLVSMMINRLSRAARRNEPR